MNNILLVDDDAEGAQALARALRAGGLDCLMHLAGGSSAALKLCREKVPAAAILDLSLEADRGVESGFETLRGILSIAPCCRVIVLTGHAAPRFGVRALQLGAANFLEKPAYIPHLIALVRDGVAQSEMRRGAIAHLHHQLDSGLIGTSAVMREVKETIRFVARSSQPVFLSGETGTGKGVAARLIHELSSRRERSFVRYQPNFTSADLIASDLFGHVKGAFTGASDRRNGLLSEACGGTFFLDEVDELPVQSQVTLLGVLQDRRFRAVGSSTEIESDFRLIAASNRSITRSLEEGKLRADFYHRIGRFLIELPPLRDRLEDLHELALHLLRAVTVREELHVFEIEAGALDRLSHHRWPGNVRELDSVIAAAAFKAQFRGAAAIGEEDLPNFSRTADRRAARPTTFSEQVEEYKLRLIEESLGRHGGNQVRAAEELALDRSTMRRILARFNGRER